MTDTKTIPSREVASYGLTSDRPHDVVPWPRSDPDYVEIDREPGAEHLHFTFNESTEPDYRELYLKERQRRLTLQGEVDDLKHNPLQKDDPRLIAIAVKAARVAENADMCPVYDLVARGCGMPDRYWLEAHGYVTAREF